MSSPAGIRESGQKTSPAKKAELFTLQDVSVSYGSECVVADVNCRIVTGEVTALIGPSGCGKSTLLRCLNRMNDLVGSASVGGCIRLDGADIYNGEVDPIDLRMRVGMVFQQPSVFPLSVYDNIAYGPKLLGAKRSELDDIVEDTLTSAALWDEVKDDLKASALGLSVGQQQRLCIARALAMHPEAILMDEPCSALDPISTQRIEDAIRKLRGTATIIIVTHNMQQARRVSDTTLFMLRESMEEPAHLVEWGSTQQVFEHPHDKRTKEYLMGRFG